MPEPWTVLEEYRGIDLLAISAWQSLGNYARIGYEVKISRSDLRRELLKPWKRKRNVAWCNEFYFAVPEGLYKPEELEFEEPEWMRDAEAYVRPTCEEVRCYKLGRRDGRIVYGDLGERLPDSYEREWLVCPTCDGKGYLTKSPAETEAPTLWVPADVGLVIIKPRGDWFCAFNERPSPKRKHVKPIGAREFGQFARWVSMRPDPRHVPRARAEAEGAAT
jgi:hypothetical protein